jgi:hypothetical protein
MESRGHQVQLSHPLVDRGYEFQGHNTEFSASRSPNGIPARHRGLWR